MPINKSENIFNSYFKKVFKTYTQGDAREESFYSSLENFIEEMGKEQNRKISATSLPKRTEAGNPDFKIWDGKHKIVGYIEAKTLETKNLDVVENSEQLKRYRGTFPNLILTNFFEFRHYRNGELVGRVEIGNTFDLLKAEVVPRPMHQDKFNALLEQFFSFSIPKLNTAKDLAVELAKRTRFLRDQVIAEEIREEQKEKAGHLLDFYTAFKENLVSSLTYETFADFYSQTITYGLFAARSRAENGFNRELAYKYIPQTVGILRKVFKFISLDDLPPQMEWIIDDISEILANTDVKKIMSDFYKKGKGKDPVIHFYETFLAEYNPQEREKRGVYYTPEPVVSFIVQSINVLLKEKFNKEDGFATESVTVLDPAAGTLTFPAYAIDTAIGEFKSKYGDGGIESLIKEHILKHFYAFELMMAPYAVSHLKIGFVLDKHGHKLNPGERFKLYLTNTLEFNTKKQKDLPGILEREIAKESEEALRVKDKIPIMVIMGNPPYSGTSENKGKWILKEIDEYKNIKGKSLGERNPKWLQDDYVKFFRFAQWKIEKTGNGVLGFITNHAWLDNPTFRGMRYSLLNTFDEIYIVNLHGSTLKKEKTPSGNKDENVFDIQPGVAIAILVKFPKVSKKTENKKISYFDIWGIRNEKYKWLKENSIESIKKWQEVIPRDPQYTFVPMSNKGWDTYDKFLKVTDIFSINSVGIITARDKFVIDFNKQALQTRINNFKDSKEDTQTIKEFFSLKDKPAFIKQAQDVLKQEKKLDECFVKILYRPFDERWICYHSSIIERSRTDVMRHMLQSNLSLSFTKRHPDKSIYSDTLISNQLTEGHLLSGALGITYSFPLYLYNNNGGQKTIFGGQQKLDIRGIQHKLDYKQKSENKEANINPKLFSALEKAFSNKPAPEEIFYYIYAVTYSDTYRKKYQHFLKIDFPKIPFTKDFKLFKQCSEIGKKLADLHLLKASNLKPLIKFYGKGNNLIKIRKYDEKNKKLFINDTQYFGNLEKSVWEYMIGGYQVLDKWLKDRKGEYLNPEQIKHYCKVAAILKETIEIQKEIDELYPKIEKSLLSI